MYIHTYIIYIIIMKTYGNLFSIKMSDSFMAQMQLYFEMKIKIISKKKSTFKNKIHFLFIFKELRQKKKRKHF